MLRFALTLLLATSVFAADSPLAGTYSLDRKSSDSIDAAINGVVSKMSFLTRGIARSRLRKTNPAYDTVALSFTGSSARVSAGPESISLPLNGSPVKWNRAGETLTVTGTLHGPTYVETFVAKDGRRTNTFAKSGDHITLRVDVTSPRLPSALRYTLVYR